MNPQLLKALHQVSLDGGTWGDASLLLPVADPIRKRDFGASEAEIEVIAGYRRARQDLMKSRTQKEEEVDPKGQGQPNDKGGKGHPKKGPKD